MVASDLFGTGTSNKSSKAVDTENRNRKFAKENSWVKFEHSKELKSHQERVRKMKPCIHTTPTIVNHPRPFQSHIRKRDLMQEGAILPSKSFQSIIFTLVNLQLL
jgi:hypothetical protein